MKGILNWLKNRLGHINFAALSLAVKGSCNPEDTRWALQQQKDCD